jgi:WD40 repeat protein
VVGRTIDDGVVPSRISPIFRDREELSASSDLSKDITEALRHSRYLIVICSPNAVASRWVNEEINAFKRMGREDRILALIVNGEPNAHVAKGFTAEDECFPEAMRPVLLRSGDDTSVYKDRLAADLRRGKDSKSNAKLRLLAGLLAINFDELKQREQERRRQFLVGLTTLACAISVLMIGLAIFATVQWQRAEDNEAQARRRLAEFYGERGRQVLLSGDPGKAAPFLSAAYQDDPSRTQVKLLLGISLRSLDGQVFALNGHTDEIRQVAFSSDGKKIVTEQFGGLLKVWDASNGTLLRTLEPKNYTIGVLFLLSGDELFSADQGKVRFWDLSKHDDAVEFVHGYSEIHDLAVSQDGKFLATASEVNLQGETTTIKVWDVPSRSLVASLSHGLKTYSIEFSQDGSRLLTAGDDGNVDLWEWRSQKKLFEFKHGSPVEMARFSPDENIIASCGQQTGVKLWSAGADIPVATFADAAKFQNAAVLEFNRTGELLLGADYNNVYLWNLKTYKLAAKCGPVDRLNSACFSSDGSLVLACSADRTARIWRTVDGQLIATLAGHSANATDCKFSPDGNRVVTVGADRRGIVWDWERLAAPIPREKFGHAVRKLDFRPKSGDLIIASALAEPRLGIWYAKTATLKVVLKHPTDNSAGGTMQNMLWALSPNGAEVATWGPDRSARVWSLVSGVALRNLAHANRVLALDFSPMGDQIATVSWDGTVSIWGSNSDIPSSQFKVPGVHTVKFIPGGQNLLTLDGTDATVWSKVGRQIFSLNGHTDQILLAKCTPDGQFIVTGSADKTARIWRVSDGSQVATLGPHAYRVQALELSQDGKTVATSGGTGLVLFWATETGRALAQWETPSRSRPKAIAFAPGNDFVAITDNSEIYLVNPYTGVALSKVKATNYEVSALAFSADGNVILIGDANGRVRAWPLMTPVGTPKQVEALLARVGPWQLIEGALVQRGTAPP